jgi:hypothetical protein
MKLKILLAATLLTGCLSDGAEDQTSVDESALIGVQVHRIVNAQYNQNMTAQTNALNSPLILQSYVKSYSRQIWTLYPAPNNTMTMVDDQTNLCAEVNNGTANWGERVDAYWCDGLSSEQWVEIPVLEPNGTPAVELQHYGTNLCLDTVGGYNSALMQWPCDPNNKAQMWTLAPSGI